MEVALVNSVGDFQLLKGTVVIVVAKWSKECKPYLELSPKDFPVAVVHSGVSDELDDFLVKELSVSGAFPAFYYMNVDAKAQVCDTFEEATMLAKKPSSPPASIFDIEASVSTTSEKFNAHMLQEISKELQGAQQKTFACILGGILADAAGCSSHWNYPAAGEMYPVKFHEKLVAEGLFETPEFAPGFNNFYHIPLGSNSCYGDQAFFLAQSLVENGGNLNVQHVMDTYAREFGDSSIYLPLDKKKQMPIDWPWRHGSLTGFLRNVGAGKSFPECGSDDSQADCFARSFPLMAMMAGSPNMYKVLEDCVRITQNNDTAVNYAKAAASVLESLLVGKDDTPANTVVACIARLKSSSNASEKEVGDSLDLVNSALVDNDSFEAGLRTKLMAAVEPEKSLVALA